MYSAAQNGRSGSFGITIYVPKEIKVNGYMSGSESPSDEGSEINESTFTGQHLRLKMPRGSSNISHELWYVMKAVKYLRISSGKECTIAMGFLLRNNLLEPYNLAAVCDQNGLDVLINLCETNCHEVRITSMKILRIITQNEMVVSAVVNLGLASVMVKRLLDHSFDSMELASTIIANIGHRRRASKAVRKDGGIPVLVSMLALRKDVLLATEESLDETEKKKIQIARWAAFALWTLAHFTKNRAMMLKNGIISHISVILLSSNPHITEPICGVLNECSILPFFTIAIETEGLVGVLLDLMSRGDRGLEWSSASTLMKAAAENAIVRDMIRFHGGLKTIVQLIKTSDESDKKLMAAAIGSLWKSAISEKNVAEYEELGGIDLLVPFVKDEDIQVQISAVGGLAEMAKNESCRKRIVVSGIIPKIVQMLAQINPELLANAAQFLGEVALDPEGMQIIEENEGVRLVWSLLRTSKDRNVIIRALWAIKSTVTRASDPGEHIRQLTGSLELLVNMLKNTDIELLTAVCTVIGEVALDYENLGVMTEQGVVRHLSKIAHLHGDEDLRRELCSAISNCCFFRPNLVAFARMRIIPVLCTYLSTKDQGLLAQACRCFFTLSRRPMNCVEMHGCGVVPFLLCATESRNRVTQISAAGCLANIRRVLLQADYRKTQDTCMKTPSTSSSSGFDCESL